MSILEQIVKTEAKVQKNIKEALEKADTMITDARKSGMEEALLIKNNVDKELNDLKITLTKKIDNFNNNLENELISQHNDLINKIKSRQNKVKQDIFKEVVKI